MTKRLFTIVTGCVIGLVISLNQLSAFCEKCYNEDNVIAKLNETLSLLDKKKVDMNELDRNIDFINKYCVELWSGQVMNPRYAGNVSWCLANCKPGPEFYKDQEDKKHILGYKGPEFEPYRYVRKVRKTCLTVIESYRQAPAIKNIIEFDDSENKLSINWNKINKKIN